MRFMRASSGVVAAVVAATLLVASPASAESDDTVTSSEISLALNSADSGQLIAEPAPAVTDADSAAVVNYEGATVETPKDPEEGVTFAVEGAPTINVEMPNADDASSARKLADGTIAYPSNNGSANAVVPVQGGAQMLTTISNADAPTRYPYKVDVPAGGKIELDAEGAANVYDAEGTPVLVVPAAWAKDRDGVAVPTRFETDGQTLTQIVEHNGNYAYPVVADPFWIIPAVIVGVVKTGFVWCGIGSLGNMAWQIFWNGWVWQQVRRAGKEGCVQGVIGRFIPWSKVKGFIKR